MARRVAPQVVSSDELGLPRPKHLRLPAETPDERYEHRLNQDLGWALKQGSLHFEEKSAVHDSLRRIAKRLDELGIPYAIAGGMALFMHDYRRFTEDVDILVAKEDIKRIHEALEGRGYRPPFERSKNLRDSENNVRIEFLLSGDYPGDGKPKPVKFPEPGQVSIERDGVRFLQLPTLVELKLASGMTSLDRAKDLVDVQELIKLLGLSADFASQLNPYVHEKYQELWRNVHGVARRYVLLWRRKWAADTGMIPEMLEAVKASAPELEAMFNDGVEIDLRRSTDDYKYLVTTDPDVARKYDMHDEDEMMPEEE
jgi:hypothetical protein